MATLSDENTTMIGRNIGRIISAFIRLLYRYILKQLEQQAERNFRQLEKRSPERIRTADINREELDKFKILAQQKGIKVYKIIDKHETPTLKYDVKDEHEITEIMKQIENGYQIPDQELMAFFERHIDTNQLIKDIDNLFNYSYEEIEQELKKPEHYQEEQVINQEEQQHISQEEVQAIYDKNVEEVTGKENTHQLSDEPATPKQLALAEKLEVPNYEQMNKVEISLALEKHGAEESYFKNKNTQKPKNELENRREKLREKHKQSEKGKTTQKQIKKKQPSKER